MYIHFDLLPSGMISCVEKWSDLTTFNFDQFGTLSIGCFWTSWWNCTLHKNFLYYQIIEKELFISFIIYTCMLWILWIVNIWLIENYIMEILCIFTDNNVVSTALHLSFSIIQLINLQKRGCILATKIMWFETFGLFCGVIWKIRSTKIIHNIFLNEMNKLFVSLWDRDSIMSKCHRKFRPKYGRP